MTNRRGFIAGATAFTLAPMFAADGRRIKTPLMLDVKRMAIHDGPGVRTTFLVKGCPLKCVWCHNPEAISLERQIARFQHLCRHCHTCTMDEATCPTQAFKVYGKAVTIDELVRKAREDRAFYDRTGGGVTISGGEPLFFWEWTYELLSACKAAGLHTCVDTSLYAPTPVIEKLLPVTDLWLPDFKCDDDEAHQRYTGVSNAVIKRNLKRLVEVKAKLEVRCLVVPRCVEDMPARYAYLDSIGVSRGDVVELEYFDYARSKYRALGIPDTMPPLLPPTVR